MRLALFVALAPLLLGSAARASSFRCKGAVISIGASKSDLASECGKPSSREARDEQRTKSTRDPAQPTTSEDIVTVTVERWLYDQGPESLVHTVVIENGKIVDIQEGGPSIARCDPLRDVNLGDTAEAVLARCGAPASGEHKRIDRLLAAPDGTPTITTIDIWTYNLGSTNLLRVLQLRDGKLVKMVTGGYGFGG